MKRTETVPLSVDDVAKRIKTSDQIVRRAIRNGALKAFLLGPRCIRIWPDDMADWIRRSEKKAKPPKPKLVTQASGSPNP